MNKKKSLETMAFAFNDGKLDGLWHATNKDGMMVEQGEFRSGLRQGTWIRHYSRVSDEYHMINEKHVNMYCEGQLEHQLRFIKIDNTNGKCISRYVESWKEGRLIQRKPKECR